MTKGLPTVDQEPKTRHPGGRPTKYRPEFAEQAKKLCALGAVNRDLADFFNVSVPTLYNWASEFPAFLYALEVGVDAANVRVRRSLFHKALGYDYAEQQAFKVKDPDGGESVDVVEVERHHPAEIGAIKFWLVNKDRVNFADVQRSELSGPNGGPIQLQPVPLEDLSDDELEVLERVAARTSEPNANT